MIQLVHWKDYIPAGFMADFEEIEKALTHAKRFDRVTAEEDKIANKQPDTYKIWKSIRWKMRHAGYESVTDGNRVLWHERGWYGTAEVVPVDGKEELRFRYFADNKDKPIFINVADLMRLKQEIGQNEVEEGYYNPDIYIKALAGKTNISLKIRRDIDFIPEVDE